MVKLTFPNADVRNVLQQYEILVGKHLIYDNQTLGLGGTVNIDIPEVPKEEAIKIIEITLIMNGFHIIPVEGNPSLLKVIGANRSPRSVAVPLIADPEPLPEGEQVVMYLVKLQYSDPAEMAKTLSEAIPPSRTEYGGGGGGGGGGNIVALPKAQALLITENTAIIRTLQRIIRATDVEPNKVEGEFVTLQRASAKDVVQMLEKLLEKPAQSASTTPSVPRPATPSNPGAVPGGAPGAATGSTTTMIDMGGLSEESLVSGKVRLTADDRTNRIYVVSRPANLALIRKLIHDFDGDVPFDEPQVRELKYVSAGEILEALVKALADPGNKDAAGGGLGGASNASQRPVGAVNPPIGQSNSSFGNQFGAGSQTGIGGGGLGARNNSIMQGSTQQGTQRSSVPMTVLIGNSRLIADNRRNAIIVIGSADVKEKVSKLLDQLDVRTPQVLLSTIIGELTLSDGEQLGVSYLLHNGARSALTSAGTASLVSVSQGNGLNTMSVNLQQLLSDRRYTQLLGAGGGGVTGFVTSGRALSAILTALESTQKFRVISRPSVFASNNQQAQISSGEVIYIASSVQSGVTTANGSTITTASPQNIGLNLQATPLINSDREVFLEIYQQMSEQIGETTVNGTVYPRLSDRQLRTSVMVPNEGTLVLGGLIKQNRNKSVTGIPILSHLPLMGPLFRNTSVDNKRTELVVMIRPSVTFGPNEDFGVRDRNLKQMRIPLNIEDNLGNEPNEKVPDPLWFRTDLPKTLPKAQPVVKSSAKSETVPQAEVIRETKGEAGKPVSKPDSKPDKKAKKAAQKEQ
ncbi:MAG: hypothetical protein RLZZ399_2370 [Verrucomicrobiota bacterium]|jgi:type II secretion system protein D